MTFAYNNYSPLKSSRRIRKTEVNIKSIRLVLRWRNKSRDLIPVAITKTQPRILSQPGKKFTDTDQNRPNRSETDQNKPKMTQENIGTVIREYRTWLKYKDGRLTGRFKAAKQL